MNEDDYKWGGNEPGPCSPPPLLQGQSSSFSSLVGDVIGYIPSNVPAMYKILPRATELLRQMDERTALSAYASLETHLPRYGISGPYKVIRDANGESIALSNDASLADLTSRLCFPFGLISSAIQTEEGLIESILDKARTATNIRTIQLVDKIKTSLPKWGDHHQKAEGNGVEQLLSAYKRLDEELRQTGSGLCSPRVVGNPDRLREIKSKSLLSECTFIEECGMTGPTDKTVPAWPDDLVLITCVRSKYDYRSYKHNTLRIAFEERMVVEAKTGPDGLQGRIVECYSILEPRPEFAFALTW